MPVPVVMKGGMPTVSSGSQITTRGIILGWKITFLVCVDSWVMTPARPTSEPVPAVVGTATTGAILSASARVHQSPISSKSQSGLVCPAMKAMTLTVSRPEPPPKATSGFEFEGGEIETKDEQCSQSRLMSPLRRRHWHPTHPNGTCQG